MKKKMF